MANTLDKKYIDIQVSLGGWDLDAGNQPIYTNDVFSIAQDIKHRILESGLARELQGERNNAKRATVLTKIEMLTESDDRIVPGTASCIEENVNRYFLTAVTKEYGAIGSRINL
ncbi:DUF2590 family protein [Vibrio algicola]|uniref:DUF2590 family protein n=1 Tax=Vibrio algicola TaxID=2662262 RepID=A0A5Q0TIN7_9VIBR|nr:DUF2590 family protein [Vibrio algicola]